MKKQNKKKLTLAKEYAQATAQLDRWKHADNYIGEEYSEYFTGPARSRDSQALEESNFESALKLLGGEGASVIVARSGHWACGWVEQILVHRRARRKVCVLAQIRRDLEDYPILDEGDHYERQSEALREYVADVYGWMDEAQQRAFIDAIGNEGLDYTDADGSIYIRKSDEERALAAAGIKREESA